MIILHFPPAAQLPTLGAQRPALGVCGGADAAPAAGGAWELPAGPAPVQLPASVSAHVGQPLWTFPGLSTFHMVAREEPNDGGLLPGPEAILLCGKRLERKMVQEMPTLSLRNSLMESK